MVAVSTLVMAALLPLLLGNTRSVVAAAVVCMAASALLVLRVRDPLEPL